MILYYETEDNSLMHYGVPGMRWGRRKASANTLTKRAAYRQAKKEYNKAYNRADARAIAAFSPSKKQREANDKRWQDAFDKGTALNKAKAEYKKAKQADKKAFKAEKEAAQKAHQNSLNKYYKDDVNYSVDKYNYGKKGVERISKRMDKGMSSFKAHTIENGRIAATTALTSIGTLAAVGFIASKR